MDYQKLKERLEKSILKFNLNLKEKVVLTEGANGNYIVTPFICLLSGAKKVYAYYRDSRYASVKEVEKEISDFLKVLPEELQKRLYLTTNWKDISFSEIDIVTNTGHLRPIDKNMIDRLSSHVVIPLMYEPWEFRASDIDLDYCVQKGIKVYGTNEENYLLRTKEYIGYIVLYFLLAKKISPLSDRKILLLGNREFADYIYRVLIINNYKVDYVFNYDEKIPFQDYDVIVISEHKRDLKILGKDEGVIRWKDMRGKEFIIHICGKVELPSNVEHVPDKPAPFGYMSFTTDYIDIQAIVDLHTAGLKVAEGMLKANELGLKGQKYKEYMERNYPALAFKDEKYW